MPSWSRSPRPPSEVRTLRGELAELPKIDDPDPEMRALAEEEVERLKAELPEAERQLAVAMLPRDSADMRPAMLEIRAGTGGDEAALFAADLFRMYERYAAEQGWRVETISMNASDVGGFKEVVANVAGTGVFAKLKFESGVHRVQRVPVTESGGRIHTSAATVAVLPEPSEVDVADRGQRPQDRHLPRVAARAASTSTPPTARCASPICPPAWW